MLFFLFSPFNALAVRKRRDAIYLFKQIGKIIGVEQPDGEGDLGDVEGGEHVIDVDTVVMSIGTSPNPLIKSTTAGLEVNARGGIVVNEDGLSSKAGVYAGGDAVTGAATVISAMGAGKVAAKAIRESLLGKA